MYDRFEMESLMGIVKHGSDGKNSTEEHRIGT